MKQQATCYVFSFVIGATLLQNTVCGFIPGKGCSQRCAIADHPGVQLLALRDSTKTSDIEESLETRETRHPNPSILLLSLTCPRKTANEFSKVVSDVWKWKDDVLGDGRDYFIPRPKTLGALQTVLQSKDIDSVTILSNCARLEVLIIMGQHDTATVDTCLESVSKTLLRQVQAHQTRRFRSPPFDWPSLIVTDTSHDDAIDADDIQTLARHWTCYTNITVVLTHWCKVAAGLGERPNRPDRAVEFRPFSSRDAHILLQFKRMVVPRGRARWCVDTALSAGKAARSNDIVRAHRGNNDSTRPMPNEVANLVQTQVLEPHIDQAVLEWNAKCSGEAIRVLRVHALHLAMSDDERQWIKSTQLHDATMALRRQDEFDTDSFLKSLQKQLEEQRLRSGNG